MFISPTFYGENVFHRLAWNKGHVMKFSLAIDIFYFPGISSLFTFHTPFQFDNWRDHCFKLAKSVPASTRLEDPSRKGTTRTAKSAPFNPCPSREGPYSTVFSVSRPMDPFMWLAGLLALSGDVETNPGPTTQTWTCDMCSTEIT